METMMFLAAALAAAPVGAADQGASVTQAYVEYQKKADEQGPDPELETQHFDRQLNLSAEQKQKVKALFVEQSGTFKKSYALRMKFQKEVMALHERILELNKKFDAEGREIEGAQQAIRRRLREVLTPKQRESYDMMMEERDRREKEFREKRENSDVKEKGGDGVQGLWGRPEKKDGEGRK